MDARALNELREEGRKTSFVQFVRIGTGLITLPLFLVFWLADLIYAPDQKWNFLFLRCLIIPVCILTRIALNRSGDKLLNIELTCSSFTLANSLIITTMIYYTEGFNSPYYAGLNLLTSGIIAMVPWSRPFLFLNVFFIYGPYYFMGLFYPASFHSTPAFVINSFFITGTLGTAIGIRYITSKLRERDIISRHLLDNELMEREQIIREKTREALRLQSLTNQFSPQVVHLIQSGKIDINSIQRSTICALFVDIVESTERVRRIDLEHVQKVISMFMQDTMTVLLKYDITIDKFLGDGVLGFSNNPIPRIDYIERAVDAALEIRGNILSEESKYSQLWNGPLAIRIGIAAGPANVGFYGSDQYFKSYTAIGRVVNLASRLCGAAGANQILISSETAEHLPSTDYQLRELGQRTLKGFEADPILALEVLDSSTIHTVPGEISVCPHGHGILYLDNDLTGLFVFRCRTCGFVSHSSEKNPTPKLAA